MNKGAPEERVDVVVGRGPKPDEVEAGLPNVVDVAGGGLLLVRGVHFDMTQEGISRLAEEVGPSQQILIIDREKVVQIVNYVQAQIEAANRALEERTS